MRMHIIGLERQLVDLQVGGLHSSLFFWHLHWLGAAQFNY